MRAFAPVLGGNGAKRNAGKQPHGLQSHAMRVTAGLVPAVSFKRARAVLIEMAGTSPAMTMRITHFLSAPIAA